MEPKILSEEAAAFLSQCRLTGNVRQLENICYWFTVMVAGQVIDVKDMPAELLEENVQSDKTESAVISQDGSIETSACSDIMQPPALSWEASLEKTVADLLEKGEGDLMDRLGRQFEKILIKTALNRTKGRKNEAAILLGMGRNTIARKIQELGLDDESASS